MYIDRYKNVILAQKEHADLVVSINWCFENEKDKTIKDYLLGISRFLAYNETFTTPYNGENKLNVLS